MDLLKYILLSVLLSALPFTVWAQKKKKGTPAIHKQVLNSANKKVLVKTITLKSYGATIPPRDWSHNTTIVPRGWSHDNRYLVYHRYKLFFEQCQKTISGFYTRRIRFLVQITEVLDTHTMKRKRYFRKYGADKFPAAECKGFKQIVAKWAKTQLPKIKRSLLSKKQLSKWYKSHKLLKWKGFRSADGDSTLQLRPGINANLQFAKNKKSVRFSPVKGPKALDIPTISDFKMQWKSGKKSGWTFTYRHTNNLWTLNRGGYADPRVEVLWRPDSNGFALFFIEDGRHMISRGFTPFKSRIQVILVSNKTPKPAVMKLAIPIKIIAYRKTLRFSKFKKLTQALKKAGYTIGKVKTTRRKRSATKIFVFKGFELTAKRIATFIPGKVVYKPLNWNTSKAIIIQLAHSSLK